MTRASTALIAAVVAAILVSMAVLAFVSYAVASTPPSSSWGSITSLPSARTDGVLGVCVVSGTTYLVHVGGRSSGTWTTNVWRLPSPFTGGWTAQSPFPGSTWAYYGGTTDPTNNRIYVFDSYRGGSLNPLAAYYYDCATDTWTLETVSYYPSSISVGYWMSVVWDSGNNVFWIYTGNDATGRNRQVTFFNPANQTFVSDAHVPAVAFHYISSSASIGGYFYLFAGAADGECQVDRLPETTAVSSTWQSMASLPECPGTNVAFLDVEDSAIQTSNRYAVIILSNGHAYVYDSSGDTYSALANFPSAGEQNMPSASIGNVWYVSGGSMSGIDQAQGYQISFTLSGPPSVTTLSETNLVRYTSNDLNSVRLNGNLTNLNGQGSVDCGFLLGLSSPPTTLNYTVLATVTTTQTFHQDVSGLVGNSVYYFRAWCKGNTDNSFTLGSILSFTTLYGIVTEPLPATNIGTERATLHGNYTDIGTLGDSCASLGFYWGTSTNPVGAEGNDTVIVCRVMPTTFSEILQSGGVGLLTPNTTYYFRTWAEGDTGNFSISTSILNFTTLANPTVTTDAPSSIVATSLTTASATFHGTLTDAGGEPGPFVTCGFIVSKFPGLSPSLFNASQAVNIVLAGPWPFQGTSLTLVPDTTYYYRAWCGNHTAPNYFYGQGSVVSFSTPPYPPSVTTLAATIISDSTGQVNGQVTLGTRTIVACGFYVSLNSNMTNATLYSVGNLSVSRSFGVFFSNLTANTTYYFFATCFDGYNSSNGAVLNFTTLPPPSNPGMDFNGAGFVALVIALITVLVWGAIKIRRWREGRGLE